jgi:hypothetical protein
VQVGEHELIEALDVAVLGAEVGLGRILAQCFVRQQLLYEYQVRSLNCAG